MVVENERDIVRSNDDDDVDGDRPSVRASVHPPLLAQKRMDGMGMEGGEERGNNGLFLTEQECSASVTARTWTDADARTLAWRLASDTIPQSEFMQL